MQLAKQVHLKFTCDPSNVDDNHYETILLLNKPTERNTEVMTIESPCPRNFEQSISLDDTHVIDPTDDSEMTTFLQPDSLQYKTSSNKLQFPNHLFVDTAAERVDDLPHDVDQLKLYKIKYSPQELVQKSQDLRYFKMHSSRRKDVIEQGRVEGALKIYITPMMNTHLSFLQKGKGILPTFRMWMETRFASAVEM